MYKQINKIIFCFKYLLPDKLNLKILSSSYFKYFTSQSTHFL